MIRRKGKMLSVHRLSYEVFVGPIPEGMHVCHKCDTPSCVNPAHLFIGTQADNIKDAQTKGRVQNGDDRYNALLDASTVKCIKQALSAGETQASLARKHRVAPNVIHRIAIGRTWKHV